MKTFLMLATAVVLTLVSSVALAGNQTKVPGNHHRLEPLGRLVGKTAPAALNGTVRFVLPKSIAAGYAVLFLRMEFVHANNGAITVNCKAIDNSGGTREFKLTTCVSVNGVCNLKFAGVYTSPSLTGNEKWVIPVGILAAHDMACTVTHGGTPSSSDTIVVDGTLATGCGG